MQKGESKKQWLITSSAFHQLLAWLDQGENSDGRNYLEMRKRLVVYFDRKNCAVPDELAVETLNRVARRLEEEGKIESEAPAKYCYITARFIFLEYLREINKTNVLSRFAFKTREGEFRQIVSSFRKEQSYY